MTVSTVEVLRGVKTGNSNFYSQLDSADPAMNTDVMSIIAAGDTHPRFVASNGSREEIPLGTQQIATLLAECGLFGVDASVVDLFYQVVTSLDSRIAPAELQHTRFRAALARMYIQSISAGNRQIAVGRARIVPVSDGTNAPLIRTGSLAITDLPTTAEAFVLGPISLNATKIKSCDGFELNLNPTQIELSDESDEYNTFAAGNTIAPVMSWTTTDPTAPSLNKVAVTGSNKLRVHLLRKKKSEGRYLNADTQHIRFEVGSGILLVQQISGSPTTFRVELHVAGTDAGGFSDVPVTISVNVAVAL